MLTDIYYFNPVKCVIFLMFIYYGSQALASVDCNFEEGFCNWMQDETDDFNWLLRHGRTPSWSTGPSSDHTTGDGYYAYIDSSEGPKGGEAWLVSPVQNAGKYCFSFWYFMYGEDVDRLLLAQWFMNGTVIGLFGQNGNRGQTWFRKQVIFHATNFFKICFVGTVFDKLSMYARNNGDIAVDDVQMLSCQDCENPVPQNAIANSTNFEYGSVIEISCDVGYTFKGVSPIVCQTGGSWSAQQSVCEPFDCGSLTIPNGKLNAAEGTTFGQTATYMCNIGYTLVGDMTVNCTAAGWSNTNSSCKIVDCGNPIISNGKLNAAEGTTYGQTATYVCNIGYTLVGDMTAICIATGWGNTNASCEILDCGSVIIPNGMLNASEGSTYGQTATYACNIGYTLVGDMTVICTATGWSNTNASCEILDCGSLTIPNGKVNTADGTTFGQTATYMCNTGFTLVGDMTVSCTTGGWSNTKASCEIVDCGNLTIPNGLFTSPNGTTFGQYATLGCNIGFTLTGNSTSVCTSSGWESTSATCESVDAENDALIAVYVIVPVIVVILAILLTIFLLRRRFPNCKKASESKQELHKNPKMAAANKTYNGLALESQHHINRAYEDRSLDGNDEYATISNEQNVNLNKLYYNIGAPEGTSNEHDVHNYDHTNDTATHFVDESYSYLSRNKIDMMLESNYNTTKHMDSGKASLRTQAQFETNSYDLLNIKHLKETAKHRKELEDGKESDYDHAHAGGIDPVAIDNDDYSHLNDVNIKQKFPASFGSGNDDGIEYSYTNAHSARKGKDIQKS